MRLRGDTLAALHVINANRGCPRSSTSVTVGGQQSLLQPVPRQASASQQRSISQWVRVTGRPIDQRPGSTRGAGQRRLHTWGQLENWRRVCCRPAHGVRIIQAETRGNCLRRFRRLGRSLREAFWLPNFLVQSPEVSDRGVRRHSRQHWNEHDRISRIRSNPLNAISRAKIYRVTITIRHTAQIAKSKDGA
jgi:hypothetical protein